MPTLYILGRFLLGAFFAVAAVRNLIATQRHLGIMTKRGVPQPQAVLYAGLALQFLGGIAVATGIMSFWGALGLIVFLIAATWMYHNFWAYSGPDRLPHINATLTNTALTGALLMVMATS